MLNGLAFSTQQSAFGPERAWASHERQNFTLENLARYKQRNPALTAQGRC
jgi:hypothetical protein